MVVVSPKGNPLIAVLLNWFPLQQYSALPSLGNMCSPGCVNGLQPYVPLACLTPHLVWRWLAAPAPIPFLPFPSPSNSLHTQHPGCPLPHSSALPLPFPSTSFLLVLIAQPLLYGWNKPQSCQQLEATFANRSHP